MFKGGKYAKSHIVNIEDMFPLQFPFGYGGLFDKRPTQISLLERMKHYLRLSLNQFQRPDFLLVLMGMYHREKSFQKAIMICKAPSNVNECKNFAEEVSILTEKDLVAAVNNCEYGNNKESNDTGNKFLKKVTA